MIRELKSFEVGIIAEGGQAFAKEANLPGGFKAEIFCANWKSYIESGNAVVIAAFDGTVITGALGAILCPDMFNGDTVAVESFWYVLKKYRGNGMRLLFKFEDWAKERAARIAMIHLEHLHPTELRKLYERLGYRHVESHYVKDFYT